MVFIIDLFILLLVICSLDKNEIKVIGIFKPFLLNSCARFIPYKLFLDIFSPFVLISSSQRIAKPFIFDSSSIVVFLISKGFKRLNSSSK
jgi:hypothetical protein